MPAPNRHPCLTCDQPDTPDLAITNANNLAARLETGEGGTPFVTVTLAETDVTIYHSAYEPGAVCVDIDHRNDRRKLMVWVNDHPLCGPARPTLPAFEALRAIHQAMNVPEWSPDLHDQVAAVLTAAGYPITAPDQPEP